MPGNYQQFTIGQVKNRLHIRLRHTKSTNPKHGGPEIITSAGSIRAGRLCHIVVTSRQFDRSICYVDGKPSGAPVTGIGDYSNWAASYKILMGNEFGLDRTWLGLLRGAAMYPKALSAAQVRKLNEEGKRRMSRGKPPVSLETLRAAVAPTGPQGAAPHQAKPPRDKIPLQK